jgi:uncharacterized membrane protein YccF (DUF307 family)
MAAGRHSNVPARYCSICGAVAPSIATFCRECGSALDVPSTSGTTVFCRDCGGEVTLGDRYCLKCGRAQASNVPERVREEPEPPAATVRYEVVQRDEPEFAVRFLWFLFVGIWLGAVTTVTAWLSIITIIGAPLGFWILRRTPTIMTLRSPKKVLQLGSGEHGLVVVREMRPAQLSLGVRALYFATVGWWFSLVWLLMAWTLSVFILPLPLTMWMFEQVPLLTTLEQS